MDKKWMLQAMCGINKKEEDSIFSPFLSSVGGDDLSNSGWFSVTFCGNLAVPPLYHFQICSFFCCPASRKHVLACPMFHCTAVTAAAAEGDADKFNVVCRCRKLPSPYLIHASAAPPPPSPAAAAVPSAASSAPMCGMDIS
jgi:hypothetical protein